MKATETKNIQKVLFLLLSLPFCFSLYAGNFFTDDLKPKGVHLVIEGAVGGDFYRSPLSPLYKTDQWVFQGTATLGYKFTNSIFAGFGGGLRHCQNDQKTGFPITGSFLGYAIGCYTFNRVHLKPYMDTRIGGVLYPKWNDSLKFYASVGGGIHILPRLTAGVQCGWYGTLDNRHSLGLLFSIGVVL